ncbi:MAG TPA: hypothetical protein DEP84_23705 [Chloroflexi bacterium]|nr:hypothetical protein [Chloroflexota bacterium]
MDDTTPVLIALLPQPRDLRLACEQGFYRVPVAQAPTALSRAQALAFYQPASFGERKWRIEWWAPIGVIAVVARRALLPAESDHSRADEPYYRVGLGRVEALDPPVVGRSGRRLLFVPTTWGRLRRAADLSDLRSQRPIADDPLYGLIQTQLDLRAFDIADEDSAHQPRLFRDRGGDDPLSPPDYEVVPDW